MDAHPDSTFAPRSPDLNAPFTDDVEPLPPQHQQYRGSISHTLTPFTPTESKSPWSRTPGWGGAPQQSSYFPSQAQVQQQHQHQPQHSYRPPPPSLPDSYSAHQPPSFSQNPFAARQPNGAAAGVGGEEPPHWSRDPMAPLSRGASRLKAEPDGEAAVDGLPAANGAHGGGGPRLDIEVKTKFPVARIKRIMQSDEDVGKVAQVTPVVVSKALELFMIDLVTTAASEAKARSSKRVTAAHLKTAVMGSAKYSDWLAEIVSKAPDAPAGGAKAAKDEPDSDEEFFGSGGGAATKKKRKAGPRKRKGGDDD